MKTILLSMGKLSTNVDDYSSSITRNGVHEIRALPVSSAELGVSGQCDVVEFRPTKTECLFQG